MDTFFQYAAIQYGKNRLDFINDEIYIMLITSLPNELAKCLKEMNSKEFDGKNYIRKALKGKRIHRDSLGRLNFIADSITFMNLKEGKDIIGFVIYKNVTCDENSIPICFTEFLNPIKTDGSDLTIKFDSSSNGAVFRLVE